MIIAKEFNIGTTSYQILKINKSGVGLAMGEAFGAILDGINSVFFNPAGLIKTTNFETVFSYTSWFQDVNYSYLGLAKKIKDKVIGTSICYLKVNNLEKRENTDKIFGYFSYENIFMNFSYANVLKKEIIFYGINLKILKEIIEQNKNNVVGIDIGVLYKILPYINFGLVTENIGKSFPFNIRIGLSYHQNKIILSSDINIPYDNLIKTCLGIEYTIYNLKFRIGYMTYKKISLGIGLNHQEGFIIDYDYTYILYELGNSHLFSVRINLK